MKHLSNCDSQRLLEQEEQKVKELIKALQAGEESGFVENFDIKKHLEMLHSKQS
jgi:antitoxin ParD1/3/4